MSLEQISKEVLRFLSDDKPEVLCIKGVWGCGKTYGWRNFLRQAKANKKLALENYSYASLFGLNSLDDLKYSLFENTVSANNIGTAPNEDTFAELATKLNSGRKLKSVVELTAAIFNRKAVADVIAKSAFLCVRKQLICLDDLERAGPNLGIREVLGLASLLKEERACKVVILINDTQHKEKEEFYRQLEKVADVTLGFDLKPEEALSIAITEKNDLSQILSKHILALRITNLRVIKKIERLAIQLYGLLQKYDKTVINESIATLVLTSWALQQPDIAPSINFLRTYNTLALDTSAGRGSLDEDTKRFHKLLDGYPFTSVNALDRIIIDGVELGYFIATNIQEAADQITSERDMDVQNSDYFRVWHEKYHGSLNIDDSDFLDSLHTAAINDALKITQSNINTAVCVLREFGEEEKADQVIASYISAHNERPPAFFDVSRRNIFYSEKIDTKLSKAFTEKRNSYIDPRDPLEVLRKIGSRRGWDEADTLLLAKQDAASFEKMFESLSGENLRACIQTVLSMGNDQSSDSIAIKKASEEAMRLIALKSPLRKRRLESFGFHTETEAKV